MRAFLTATAVALTLTLTAACQPAAGGDEQAIRDLETRWNQLIVARDVPGVVGLYAEDGMIMPSGGPAAQGPAALTEVWTGLFGMPGLTLTITPVEVKVAASRDLAMDRGTYALTTTGPAGEVTDNGKYVVVWKKVGADWKVAADIFNSDAPPPAPAPAPTPAP